MSFVAVGVAGLTIGAAGTVGKIFGAKKANKTLEELQKQDPNYSANPIAAQRYGLASTLLNARAPGAVTAERNIDAAGSNAYNNIERTATDSSTALLAGAGILGQTDQAFQDLQQKETEDYQRRYANYTAAQEGMITEGDKMFQDKVRRFQDKVGIKGAQVANNANAWQSLSNFGYGVANFGVSAAGGFGGVGKNIGTGGYSIAGAGGTGGI